MDKKPQVTFMRTDGVSFDPEFFEQQAQFYRETIMRYHCAILEIQTKLEVLNSDLSVRYSRNPIEFIKSRVKEPRSIVQKLRRKGLELTVENVINGINDVAGIRVVCSFIDDIYEIADMLARQDDVTVLEVKDYIKNPKPGGYRSYHMIVQVPVFFADKPVPMKVEVQIRTIAMDFWASLEHDLRYKKDLENSDAIAGELRSCADIIHDTDLRMQRIQQSLSAAGHSEKP